MSIETGAMIIGWKRAVVGREAQASELFSQTLAYYDKLQKAGKLTSYEPVFLAVHAGQLNGFMLLRGTHGNLNHIRADEEFVDLVLRAEHCLEEVCVIPAYVGSTITEMMGRWAKQIPR